MQFPLQSGAAAVEEAPVRVLPDAAVTWEGETVRAAAGDLAAEFEEKTGHLVRLSRGETVYLCGPVRACFDRPISGLDCQAGWGWWDIFSAARGLEEKCTRFAAFAKGDTAFVEAEYGFSGAFGAKLTLRWRLTAENLECDAQWDIDPAVRALPRVGLELVAAPGLEALTYLGCGPNESYCDRKMTRPLAGTRRRWRARTSHSIRPRKTAATRGCAGWSWRTRTAAP